LKSTLRQLIVTAFILLIVFTGVQFTLQSFRVEGASMEDSFHNGEYLLVNKLSYHFHSPQRGDVIVFHYPLDPSRLYIKRVIGLPGERVEIDGDNIYIDGKLLQEKPSRGPMGPPYKNCSLTVPSDEYFVLGDNRAHSDDSRTWGTVPRANIIGKTLLTYWPLSEWGLSPEYSWALE
jgi:signal peptidase I